MTERLDFSQVPAVRAVPVVTDWRALTRDEFVSRADVPMIFKGLGGGADARAERARGPAAGTASSSAPSGTSASQIRARVSKNGRERPRQAVPLREFIAALDAGEEGVYAAEWYLFKEHPELLQDAIGAFPDYLLDDWLESVRAAVAVRLGDTHNVYWGATGSVTPVHYDSLNACTWNLTLKGVKRWLLFPARAVLGCRVAGVLRRTFRARGLLTEEGLFTPETVQACLDAALPASRG